MAGRGHFTPFGGARLPIGKDHDTGTADPANGARVARCKACGMPNAEHSQLHFLELVEAIRGVTYEIVFAVCEHCLLLGDVRPRTDPLDVQAS